MTNAYECTTQPQRSQAADPLRTRDFRLLVAGLGISLFANLMLRFAMSMWVLDKTGSAAAFASILTASILPTILLSPLGGVMADRTNRRTVMVALDALSAVTVLVCVAIFSAAGFNLAAIAVMQVVLAVLDAMETPTVQAALPQMFRSHGEDVMRCAMAVVNVVNQTSTLVPAVLGGVLYAAVGAMPMMVLTIVGFGAAAVVECFIRLGAPDRGDAGRVTAVDDLRAAGRFLTRERPHVLHLVLICAALNFLVTGYAEVGFPYMVRTVLGFGSTAYGLAYGLVGASGLLGALVGGRVARSLSMRRFPMAIAAFSLTILPQALVMTIPRRWSDATRGAHGEHLRNHDRHHPREPHRRAGDPDGLPRGHDRQGDVARALREHVRSAPRTDRIRLGVQRPPGGRGPGGDVRPGHRDAAASRARNAAVLGRDSITFALDS